MFAAGGVEDAGVIAAAVTLALVAVKFAERIFDAWRKSRQTAEIESANDGPPHFRATDRHVLGKIQEVVCRTDGLGKPLVYASAEMVDVLRKQTELLKEMSDRRGEELEVLRDRVNICDGHTEILAAVKRRLEA